MNWKDNLKDGKCYILNRLPGEESPFPKMDAQVFAYKYIGDGEEVVFYIKDSKEEGSWELHRYDVTPESTTDEVIYTLKREMFLREKRIKKVIKDMRRLIFGNVVNIREGYTNMNNFLENLISMSIKLK